MNQIATRDDTRLAAIEDKINRDVSSAIAVGTGGITFQNAGEVMEYAKMMAVSGSAVPKHLRGQPGACLGIIDDAIRFKTSPYALARKSFFVNDNLAYEAQVIAGIINRFAPIKERPDVQFAGEGGERKCIVTFKFLDGSTRTYESPKFKDIHPKNSPLWKNDPDQQHSYYSLRAGARRHCPEIILGMFDVDELRQTIDHRDDEPQPSVMTRLQQRQQPQETREGFDPAHVARETGTLAGEAAEQEHEPSSIETGDDAGSGQEDPSLSPAADNPADAADQAGAIEADHPETAAPATDPLKRMLMEECIDNMLREAFSDPADQREAKIEKLRTVFLDPQNLADFPEFVNRCAETVTRIAGKPNEKARAREYLIGRIPA